MRNRPISTSYCTPIPIKPKLNLFKNCHALSAVRHIHTLSTWNGSLRVAQKAHTRMLNARTPGGISGLSRTAPDRGSIRITSPCHFPRLRFDRFSSPDTAPPKACLRPRQPRALWSAYERYPPSTTVDTGDRTLPLIWRSAAAAGVAAMRRFMNAKFFEEQRREMVAAIRAIAEHIAAELGKTALDERVLRAMAKVPRHGRGPVLRLPEPANPDRFR